jgi:hypothetical protein
METQRRGGFDVAKMLYQRIPVKGIFAAPIRTQFLVESA